MLNLRNLDIPWSDIYSMTWPEYLLEVVRIEKNKALEDSEKTTVVPVHPSEAGDFLASLRRPDSETSGK
jgi:hypothetical protein